MSVMSVRIHLFILSFVSISAAEVFYSVAEDAVPKTKSEFNKKYLEKSLPVVFREAAKSWPAIKWDLDYFKNNYGQAVVTVLKKETLTDKKMNQCKMFMKMKFYRDILMRLIKKVF